MKMVNEDAIQDKKKYLLRAHMSLEEITNSVETIVDFMSDYCDLKDDSITDEFRARIPWKEFILIREDADFLFDEAKDYFGKEGKDVKRL